MILIVDTYFTDVKYSLMITKHNQFALKNSQKSLTKNR